MFQLYFGLKLLPRQVTVETQLKQAGISWAKISLPWNKIVVDFQPLIVSFLITLVLLLLFTLADVIFYYSGFK